MKKYKVFIYDSESGCDQPITCEASSEAEARRKGNEYIRAWRLVGATVTLIRRMEE